MWYRNFALWIFLGLGALVQIGCGNDKAKTEADQPANEPTSQRITDADFYAAAVNAFSTRKANGTFVLEHLDGERHVHNPARADTRMCPASTFKIPNTLIALESGIAADTSTFFEWDGVNRRFRTWNKGMSLRQAYKYSALWIYQEIASQSDLATYADWLEKFDYGNQETGSELTNFWINNDLQITPIEQVEFLKKLYSESLPLSERTYELTKSVMEAKQFTNAQTYSKTGWAVLDDAQYVWYVGWVEKEGGDGPWFFAVNLDISNQKEVKKRFGITNEILSKTLGLTVKQQPKKQPKKKKPMVQQPGKTGNPAPTPAQ